VEDFSPRSSQRKAAKDARRSESNIFDLSIFFFDPNDAAIPAPSRLNYILLILM
jgi:hypothetical protein